MTSPLTEVLAAGGAPAWLAPAVVAALGPTAAVDLGEDPWRLLGVPGVRPEQADGYARSRLGPQARPDDPRRALAVVGWLLARAARDGHTAMYASTVCRALPAFGFPDAEATLAAVVAGGDVLALEGGSGDAEERPLLLALEHWAMAEASLAEGVQRLLATARHLCGADQVELASLDGGTAGEAVRAAVTSGVSVAVPETAAATGPLVEAFRRLADATDQHLLVAAATCRSADHIGAATTRDLLRGDAAADLVVVTEAALLDVASAAALVESLRDGAHLVLVDDPTALASPGPGRVLAELAESGAVPVSHVGGGPQTLARLAAGLRAGRLPAIDPADREVVVVPAREAGEAVHRAVQLVSDSIPRVLGLPPEEILVVTPRRGGRAGADALNAACKSRLNPGPGALAGFDPGDRVVVTSGAVPAAPYGEIGHIVGGSAEAGVDVDFCGGRVTVPADQIGALRRGWAVTAQQALAASWPAVVAVLPGEAAGSLSRALVISAATAARAHLSVVHAAGPALAQAVERVPRWPRVTQRLPLTPPSS